MILDAERHGGRSQRGVDVTNERPCVVVSAEDRIETAAGRD
jgi:hypothetical protein